MNIYRPCAKWNNESTNAGKQGRLQGWRPTLEKPNTPRPADGVPHDVDQHMRLMCDILVLAFQTDTTRICTLEIEQRPFGLAIPESQDRLHDPPSALAHRQRRLAEGESILRGASGLHRREARQDSRRRTHRAGQHHAAVPVEHAARQPRLQPIARGDGRAAAADRSAPAACSIISASRIARCAACIWR